MFQSSMMQIPLTQAGVQRQPDWDSEFSKIAELTSQDKGKGRMVEVTDDGLDAAFSQLGVESKEADPTGNLDDYMASFEKYVPHFVESIG